MPNCAAVALGQIAQRGVEAARAEEEAGVQHLPVPQLAPEAVAGHLRASGGVAQIRRRSIRHRLRACGRRRTRRPGGTRRSCCSSLKFLAREPRADADCHQRSRMLSSMRSVMAPLASSRSSGSESYTRRRSTPAR